MLCFIQMNIQTVIGISVVCFSIVIGVPIILNSLSRFKKIKISAPGGTSIDFGDGENKSKENSEVADRACLGNTCNPIKINLISMKIMDVSFKLAQMKFFEILEEQKQYAEQKLLLLQDYDNRNYLSFLIKKLSNQLLTEDNIIKSDDYQMYVNISDRTFNGELYKLFCQSFLENHLDSYDNLEWEEYKRNKIRSFISLMNEILKRVYLTNAYISMSEWKYESKKFSPFIEESFDEIFEKAKKISSAKKIEMSNMRKDLDSFLFKVCHDINFSE